MLVTAIRDLRLGLEFKDLRFGLFSISEWSIFYLFCDQIPTKLVTFLSDSAALYFYAN